jgi:hypothetical protein
MAWPRDLCVEDPGVGRRPRMGLPVAASILRAWRCVTRRTSRPRRPPVRRAASGAWRDDRCDPEALVQDRARRRRPRPRPPQHRLPRLRRGFARRSVWRCGWRRARRWRPTSCGPPQSKLAAVALHVHTPRAPERTALRSRTHSSRGTMRLCRDRAVDSPRAPGMPHPRPSVSRSDGWSARPCNRHRSTQPASTPGRRQPPPRPSSR